MKIKYIFSFLFIILFSGLVFPQFSPNSFYLLQDKKISKLAGNPPISSNSISDIITVGDTIWIGTGQGVSYSSDNGNTWTNFTNDKIFGTESISAIGYYNGVFWAATAADTSTDQGSMPRGGGLKYTSDGGKSWTSIPEPVDNYNDTTVAYGKNTLRALPVTVTINNLIYDMAFTPGTIWIATFAGGLRKSTDMGKTWQRVVLPPDYLDEVKPSDTLHFCMQPVSGSFCTENNLNYRVFSVLATNDSTLYVGTADGINKSTDNGISWIKYTHTNETNPISGNFVVALGYQNSNNTIWAATWPAEGSGEYYGVSFSSDGGANWKTSLNGEQVHNFGFKNGEDQVIAVSDEGAFRSANNGSSWTLPSDIIDKTTGLTLNTTAFYAASFQNNYVWLGSAEGLARLDESGGSAWTGVWKIYFASQPLKSESDTYAYPNPFNPSTDILKIKYDVSGTNESVTIRIFDFGMHYIRTIIQNASRGNSHSVDQSGGVIDYWDGKDAEGKTVPNGVYFYRIDAGSQNPVYGKILVIH